MIKSCQSIGLVLGATPFWPIAANMLHPAKDGKQLEIHQWVECCTTGLDTQADPLMMEPVKLSANVDIAYGRVFFVRLSAISFDQRFLLTTDQAETQRP